MSDCFESPQATSSLAPPSSVWMWRGRLQVRMVPTTASVLVSTIVSVWSFSLDT